MGTGLGKGGHCAGRREALGGGRPRIPEQCGAGGSDLQEALVTATGSDDHVSVFLQDDVGAVVEVEDRDGVQLSGGTAWLGHRFGVDEVDLEHTANGGSGEKHWVPAPQPPHFYKQRQLLGQNDGTCATLPPPPPRGVTARAQDAQPLLHRPGNQSTEVSTAQSWEVRGQVVLCHPAVLGIAEWLPVSLCSTHKKPEALNPQPRPPKTSPDTVKCQMWEADIFQEENTWDRQSGPAGQILSCRLVLFC